jgi:hypothetical protein
MPSQYYKFLTLVVDIANAYALTDNIGKIVKLKYFVNTFRTMTRNLP